jgi:hypothetical protein
LIDEITRVKQFASFTFVGKGDKNRLVSFFKLFEGVPFFLSIYSIKIPSDSIKNRDAAQQERRTGCKLLMVRDGNEKLLTNQKIPRHLTR